jgi:hypothetical protein
MLMRPPKMCEETENISHIHTESDERRDDSRSRNKNKIK